MKKETCTNTKRFITNSNLEQEVVIVDTKFVGTLPRVAFLDTVGCTRTESSYRTTNLIILCLQP